MTRTSGRCSPSSTAGRRRQHHRDVLHRRRPRHESSWPDTAITPLPEQEVQLGRRVPHARDRCGRRPRRARSRQQRSGRRISTRCPHCRRRPRHFQCEGAAPDGREGRDKTVKVRLDGYNLLPYLTGQVAKSPRQEFFYYNDDGDLMTLPSNNSKLVFSSGEPGHDEDVAEPYTQPRGPNLNLRAIRRARGTSPRTPATTGCSIAFLLVRCRPTSARSWSRSRVPRRSQKSASYSVDQVLDRLREGAGQ